MGAPLQSVHNYPGNVGTLPDSVGAGNLLVVCASWSDQGGVGTFGISDTLGNTWPAPTISVNYDSSSEITTLAVWYAWGVLGGADSVTVDNNDDVGITVYEYSASDIDCTSDPLLTSVGTQSGGIGGAPTTDGFTTSETAVAFVAYGDEDAQGNVTGFTASGYDTLQIDNNHWDAQADLYGLAPGTYTASVDVTATDANWCVGVLAFRAAGGSPPPPPPPPYTEPLAGACTVAGSFTKSIGKGYAGSIAIGGSLALLTGKTINGSVAIAGALARSAAKHLAGSVEPAGTLAKSTSKPVAGTVEPSGALARVADKALAGSLEPAGAVAKSTGKSPAGSIEPAAAVVKSIAKSLAGSIEPAAALARGADKALVGSVEPSGAQNRIKALVKSFAGSVEPAGAMAKSTGKSVGGTIEPAGILTRSTAKPLGGSVEPSGIATRSTGKGLSGSLEPSGAQSRIKAAVKALSGAIAAAGSLARATAKALSGSVAGAGAFARTTVKTLGATVEPAGSQTRFKGIARAFAGSLTAAGSLARSVAKWLLGYVAGAGTLATAGGRVVYPGTVVSLTAADTSVVLLDSADTSVVSLAAADTSVVILSPDLTVYPITGLTGELSWPSGQLQLVTITPTLPAGRALSDWAGFSLAIRQDPLWPRSGALLVADVDPGYQNWPGAGQASGTVSGNSVTFPISVPPGAGRRRYALDVQASGGVAGQRVLVPGTWLSVTPAF